MFYIRFWLLAVGFRRLYNGATHLNVDLRVSVGVEVTIRDNLYRHLLSSVHRLRRATFTLTRTNVRGLVNYVRSTQRVTALLSNVGNGLRALRLLMVQLRRLRVLHLRRIRAITVRVRAL